VCLWRLTRSALSYGDGAAVCELVRDLQRQNLELSGMVGSLQQRLLFAEDRIRAQEAPREADSAKIALGVPSDNGTYETSNKHRPSDTKRAWWRFW
jgi:hypothetical protein